MAEILRGELNTQSKRLVELQTQRIYVDEQIEQQERQIIETKASILGVGPDTTVARNADSVIIFADANDLDPQWLARLFITDIRNVMKSPSIWGPPKPTSDSEHVKHYEYALEMIRKGKGNAQNPYRFLAKEHLEEAWKIAQRQEQGLVEDSRYSVSMYYKFLESNIAILEEAARNYHWENS